MDAAQALQELMELSSQVDAAAVLGPDGDVVASAGESRTGALAGAALELIAAAAELGSGADVTRVEVELEEGALFVLREGDAVIAARTGPDPTSGLVIYDLRTCLRSILEEEPKRRKPSRQAKEDAT
jgi:predicted regulator of Ras-like GTPase activity (Roadblock/LC7/MglB family)